MCSGSYSPKTTLEIKNIVMSESGFPEVGMVRVRNGQTRALLLRHEKYDVDFAVQTFYKEAGVRFGAPYFDASFARSSSVIRRFRANATRCFRQLLGTNVVLAVVYELKNTQSPSLPLLMCRYDRSNDEHEALLLQLWVHLKPNEVCILPVVNARSSSRVKRTSGETSGFRVATPLPTSAVWEFSV